MLFERNYQRYIVNVTTKRVHWGLKREIIGFDGIYQKLARELENESHKRLYIRDNH